MTESAPQGPGAELKASREGMEVSTREVADALNLPVHVIESLEADDYDGLPPSVFTRGYLRSYARLLELDPDRLLIGYPEVTEEVEMVTGEMAVASVTGGVPRQTIGLIIAAVIAVLLIALLVWLLNGSGGDEPDAAADNAVSPAEEISMEAEAPAAANGKPAAANGKPAAANGKPAAANGKPAAATATRTTGTESGSGADQVLEAVISETVAPAESDKVRVPGEVPEPLSASAESAAAESAAAESAAAETESAAADAIIDAADRNIDAADINTDTANGNAVATGSATSRVERRITEFGDDVVTLVFAEDCWVSVKSMDEMSLYSDLNRSGQTLVLTGRAPFRVRLGYAPGVSVSFNGEAVSVERYTRNNVANLVVGE